MLTLDMPQREERRSIAFDFDGPIVQSSLTGEMHRQLAAPGLRRRCDAERDVGRIRRIGVAKLSVVDQKLLDLGRALRRCEIPVAATIRTSLEQHARLHEAQLQEYSGPRNKDGGSMRTPTRCRRAVTGSADRGTFAMLTDSSS